MNKLLKFAVLTAVTSALLSMSASAVGIKGGPHDFSSTGGYNPTTPASGGNPAVSVTGLATFKWGGATTTYENPCQVCHIPHKAPSGDTANAPLWNHALPSGYNSSYYVTYEQGKSARFNAMGFTMALGSSVACLSCHDGSTAINQQYGKTVAQANVGGSSGQAYYVPTFAVEAATATAGNFDSATGTAPYTTAYGTRNNMTHMHPIGVVYDNTKDTTLQDPTTNPTLKQMLKAGPSGVTVECASCHDIHGAVGVSGTISHEVIVDLNNAALCATCHKQVQG